MGGKRKNRIQTKVPRPTSDGDEDEDEVELEDGVDEQEPEDRQARPQQPLLERHERRVAMEASGLDVVEHHGRDEQDEGRGAHRVEEVREVLRAEAAGKEERIEEGLVHGPERSRGGPAPGPADARLLCSRSPPEATVLAGERGRRGPSASPALGRGRHRHRRAGSSARGPRGRGRGHGGDARAARAPPAWSRRPSSRRAVPVRARAVQLETYQPAVYAGILARRHVSEELSSLAELRLARPRHRRRRPASLRAPGGPAAWWPSTKPWRRSMWR